MCLVTTQKEPKIAEKDMKVFKTLSVRNDDRDELYAAYHSSFKYTLGVLYETEIKKSTVRWCYDGIESFYLRKHFPDHETNNDYGLKWYGEGFHSAGTRERVPIFYPDVLFEATIPKGSEYYESLTGLLISNKIIINRQL